MPHTFASVIVDTAEPAVMKTAIEAFLAGLTITTFRESGLFPLSNSRAQFWIHYE